MSMPSMVHYYVLCAVLILLAAMLLGHVLAGRRSACAAAQQAAASAARHGVLLEGLAGLKSEMAALEERQARRNLEQLSAALAGVISDFQQRIMAQFDAHLQIVSQTAQSSQQLYARQRTEQMEAMHHARRLAERMEQAAQEFGVLVADSSALASLSAAVRQSLDLLEPRQQALDSGIAQQAQSVQAMAEAMTGLRVGFDVAAEQMAAQSRRAFEAMAQRAAQNGSTLNKELADTLAKAMSGVSKQLAAMAPMTQQLKRAAEQPRNGH
jgi:uncharacterized coiled-coil protein SlyX